MMRLGVKMSNCVHALQFDVAVNCFLTTVVTSRSFLLKLQPSYSPNATFFIYLVRMGINWESNVLRALTCSTWKRKVALQRYLGVSVHVNILNYAADKRRQMPEDSRGQWQRGHRWNKLGLSKQKISIIWLSHKGLLQAFAVIWIPEGFEKELII